MTQTDVMTTEDNTTAPVSNTLRIDLSLVSPHDGSVLATFTDDGALNEMLAERIASSVPLSHWLPTVAETDQWDADAWRVWLESCQRLAANLAQPGKSQEITLPQSELSPEQRKLSAIRTTVGEGGVVMATFTTTVMLPDPVRDTLVARLAALTAFVTEGQDNGSSLRNNLLFSRPPHGIPADEPTL